MNKTKQKKFVIIDGNAIVHRAYHALPPLTAKDGTVVNAVYGFTSMLLKIYNDLKPDYLAVSFDVEGGTFRDEIYAEYKATRVKADQELYDQIPLVYEVVNAFDIPIYSKKGYEADDVIGTMARKLEYDKSIKSVIVTGDMDMLQLVDNAGTEVYLLRKGLSDFHLYNETAVKKRFGFGPEHIVDYKAMRGDSSDNIPGISGIGEKTATKLITEIGGLEDIYKEMERKNNRLGGVVSQSMLEKLRLGKEQARMSHHLARVRRDVKGLKFDIDRCRVRELDVEKISSLLKKFEFYSLVSRIPGNHGITGKKKQKKSVKRVKMEAVGGRAQLERLLRVVEGERVFAAQAVLGGKNILKSDFTGLLVSAAGSFFYVKLENLNKTQQKQLLGIFKHKEKTLVGHDLKNLLKGLMIENVVVKNKLFDVMIASYLLNSSTRAHDLKSIILRELDQRLPDGSEQESLFGVDPQVLAAQLDLILKVKDKQIEELDKWRNKGLFEKIEMPLIPVLARMELNGVAVDTGKLKALSRQAAAAIEALTKRIWREAGEKFNVASSVQLREVLYEKMELPSAGIKKGKTGYSTAASELEKLRGVSPIIEMIEEYRELEKLRNTYIDVLPMLINKKTGRIHTSFNQAVTSTGRLSSSDPNLQNIPIRTELGKQVRDTFVAEPGNVLLAADYSQIELRIAASLADDKKMIEIFEKGQDIHQATAAAINGVPLDQVTKKMRYGAKEVNFGVLYGMGAYGLSWRAKISLEQAREFIDKYFKEFAGVKQYLDNTLRLAKRDGYVETLFGRRRYVPELKSGNYQLRSAGERMAINMPIQGTAADLIKLAMIEIDKKMRQEFKNRPSDARMILQVHDELVFEVKKGLEKKLLPLVKQCMESVAELRVPILVEAGVGKNWGEIK